MFPVYVWMNGSLWVDWTREAREIRARGQAYMLVDTTVLLATMDAAPGVH